MPREQASDFILCSARVTICGMRCKSERAQRAPAQDWQEGLAAIRKVKESLTTSLLPKHPVLKLSMTRRILN